MEPESIKGTQSPSDDPYLVSGFAEDEKTSDQSRPISFLCGVLGLNALGTTSAFFALSEVYKFPARWVLTIFLEGAIVGCIIGQGGIARRVLILIISITMMFVVLLLCSAIVMVL